MKNNILFSLAVFLLAIHAQAQEMTLITEDDGTYHQGALHDGLKQGVWKKYLNNDVLFIEATYQDDRLHGVAKTYYVNGRVHFKSYYENGILQGEQYEYDVDGSLISSKEYENNGINGYCKFYDSEGNLTRSYHLTPDGALTEDFCYTKKGKKRSCGKSSSSYVFY